MSLADILALEHDGALLGQRVAHQHDRQPKGVGMTSPINFSTIKHIAESPLHFRHVLEHGVKVTKAMRVGTVVHQLVLGKQGEREIVRYEGTRRGAAWEAFKAKHEVLGNEIVSNAEWEEAEPIAAAVLAHEGACELLDGARCEVPLRWEINGVPFATRGIDAIPFAGGIVDLKSARTANPRNFLREALKMHYHVQLALYEEGARQNGIDTSGGVRLIAAESKAPYPVQVFRLTPALLERGRKELALWIETLKACAAADHWPAYSLAELEWDVPPEAVELEFDDEDEDDDQPSDDEAA